MVFYSMLLVIFICMLFMELFVGVVIETFNKQQELLNNNGSLGRRQFSWITFQLKTMKTNPVIKLMPDKDNNRFRNWCISLTEHRYFDMFILIAYTCPNLPPCVDLRRISVTSSRNSSPP